MQAATTASSSYIKLLRSAALSSCCYAGSVVLPQWLTEVAVLLGDAVVLEVSIVPSALAAACPAAADARRLACFFGGEVRLNGEEVRAKLRYSSSTEIA